MKGIRLPLHVEHRCSNGGITDQILVEHVTLVEICGRAMNLMELPDLVLISAAIRDGMHAPDPSAPAVRLLKGNMPANPRGRFKIVPVEPHPRQEGGVGPMMGGSYVDCPALGLVALHDRWETPAQYEALSR